MSSIASLFFLLILIVSGSGLAGEARSKFEPPEGRVLHGWGQHTILYQKETLPYIESCGRYCALISLYTDLSIVNGAGPELIFYAKEKNPKFVEGLDDAEIKMFIENYFPTPAQFGAFRKITGKNYIPLIAVSWHRSNDRNISEGMHDREIETLAEQVKSCGFPVFLRPGSECGPYGYNDKTGQTSREYYAKMFRRFVDIFRKKGVENASFVWCTVGVEAYDYWMDYYAGDDYVDWWGVNLFSRNQITGCGSFLEEAKKHGKPVMICESAPAFEGGTLSDNSIDSFFKPFFELFDRHGHIKAFVYINIDWAAEKGSPFAHWPDSRIQSNPKAAGFYRAAISHPRFVHLGDIQSTKKLQEMLGP
ncbi:MAG: glycosyl hydrolase [Gemmatimonadota bacterium]|nr:glycosyl hydrolase [Gemmatimonadota bacterium]